MASATGVSFVKAGYWFCGPNYFLRPLADIPSELFTHLYAGFAEVNPDDGGVALPNGIPSPYLEQFQTFTKTVRERSLQVKTLLSIGGEGSDISSVARDKSKRQKFIRTSIDLAKKYEFDGLDLCWLYPSPSDNAADLHSFLKEWRDAVKKEVPKGNQEELLLTAVVSHHPVIIPAEPGRSSFYYPCQAILDNLDWINVLAIDFYTPSNSSGETGPVHAWLNPKDKSHRRYGSAGITDWISNGVATNQLVLGLPFHGYEWSLKNSNNCGFFAPAHPANQFSIDYRTIKANIEDPQNEYIKPKYDPHYVATYTYNSRRSWIGYDDKRCISRKVTEAFNGTQNLGGCFEWHLGADDDEWTLTNAAFGEWPPQPVEANDP